jgi:hypothetical protein
VRAQWLLGREHGIATSHAEHSQLTVMLISLLGLAVWASVVALLFAHG